MGQPTWLTSAGTIGTFTETLPVVFTFIAAPFNGAGVMKYFILNGEFPESTTTSTVFSLNENTGVLTGTPAQVNTESIYYFSIRAIEYVSSVQVGFRDRTFSMTVTGATIPTFLTPAGQIYPGPTFLPDSSWYPFQISINNPDPDSPVTVTLDMGELPPGLELSSNGFITGYATPPTLPSQSYSFMIKVENAAGYSLRNFSITVVNQTSIPTLRTPTILNNRPLSYTLSPDDPYQPYYRFSSPSSLTVNIGTLYQDNYFIFKINGYSFDNNIITYNLFSGSLPTGLTLNTTTGWITGTIATNPFLIQSFSPMIRVYDTVTLQYSAVITFNMVVVSEINDIPVDYSVIWETPTYLGQVNNGDISTFSFKAYNPSGLELEYTTVTPLLDNMSLTTDGELIGRIPFEPYSSVSAADSTSTFYITVNAQNPTYSLVFSQKTFAFNIYQKYQAPYQNLYMKALLNLEQRSLLDNFLYNTILIPNELLYRPNDSYFGKATDIKYLHFYGIEASTLQQFIDASAENYYWRDITLGPLRTAVARNSQNEIIYEVVYCEIIDNLINPEGESINNKILWPVPINSVSTFVYPNSLPNMENRLIDSDYTPDYINNLNTDGSVLPLWMTSQQIDGSTLGFVRSWVICYTKPGGSDTVLNNLTKDFVTQEYIVTATDYATSQLNFGTTGTTEGFYVNMPLQFTSGAIGGLSLSTIYYIKSIVDNKTFTISSTVNGTTLAVSNSTGSMQCTPLTGIGFNLNILQFKLDRFTVDNSLTYNYDPAISPPSAAWSVLPSEGVSTDSEDFNVYFPKQNILN